MKREKKTKISKINQFIYKYKNNSNSNNNNNN